MLAALAVAGACDRPRPIVLCHNGNCASADVTADDTLHALDASLRLRFQGRPVLDGVEVDAIWDGAADRCAFAHDAPAPAAADAVAAAETIAAHLTAEAVPSWNGDRFYVFIELKGHVGASFDDKHTAVQREQHADCVLDMLDVLRAGAAVHDTPLEVTFTSTEPLLLETLCSRPRWPGRGDGVALDVRLAGDIGVLPPSSTEAARLASYRVPLQTMEYHQDYMMAGQYQAYRSLGLDLAQWGFVVTASALDALERYEPRYLITSEAAFMRRWIER